VLQTSKGYPTRQIRQQQQLSKLPVLGLTGHLVKADLALPDPSPELLELLHGIVRVQLSKYPALPVLVWPT